MIKELKDPVNDLRKMMEVKPVEDTFLIKVALGLPDGEQAALIVDAVVKAYFAYSDEYKSGANENLRKILNNEQDKLRVEVKGKEDQLKALIGKGNVDAGTFILPNRTRKDDDATKPTLSTVTIEQSQMIAGELMKTELELIEAEANLKVVTEAEDAMKRANEEGQGQRQLKLTDEQEHLIQEEFLKDPEVIALRDDLLAAQEQRDHVRSLARSQMILHAARRK